jgi:hypothetical protein
MPRKPKKFIEEVSPERQVRGSQKTKSSDENTSRKRKQRTPAQNVEVSSENVSSVVNTNVEVQEPSRSTSSPVSRASSVTSEIVVCSPVCYEYISGSSQASSSVTSYASFGPNDSIYSDYSGPSFSPLLASTTSVTSEIVVLSPSGSVSEASPNVTSEIVVCGPVVSELPCPVVLEWGVATTKLGDRLVKITNPDHQRFIASAAVCHHLPCSTTFDPRRINDFFVPLVGDVVMFNREIFNLCQPMAVELEVGQRTAVFVDEAEPVQAFIDFVQTGKGLVPFKYLL